MNLQSKMANWIFLLGSVCFNSNVLSQNIQKEQSIHSVIEQHTQSIFDSLVSIRRDLYRHPEVGGEEKRTSGQIKQYLKALGLEVQSGIGGHGVVGVLKGNTPGKSIAWRADIDALATDFPDASNFKSENEGVRHICGHDVHTTVALGIANVLSSLKAQLKGTVYFVFQPSEENLTGAKAMMDDGLLNKVAIDEIYALHISPFPQGTIATKPRGLFADYKKIEITFKSSESQDSLIDFTKKLILKLQKINEPDNFWDTMNLGHPTLGIASPTTIYKEYVIIDENFEVVTADNQVLISTYATVSDQQEWGTMTSSLKQQIAASPYTDNFVAIEYFSETPTIDNNTTLTNETLANLSAIYGQERVITLYGTIADGRSDDFALFQQKVPGVYFFLGASDYEKGIISMPHAPDFTVDESSIKTGVQMFSSMLVDRLSK